MVLDRPIADWWFEDRTNLISCVGSEQVISLIKMCEKCISILERFELLSLSRVLFSDTWILNDVSNESAKRVVKKEFSLEYKADGIEKFGGLALDKITSMQVGEGYLYPSLIKFVGTGVLKNEYGVKQEFENVIIIEAQFTEALVVDVITHSTAWLPFTLKGMSQAKVYEYNSPRLKCSLEEIEAALGIKPVYDKVGDFCSVKGYELDNFRDIDGVLIPVDETGRIM
jgi:hypothetical protein